MASRKLPEGMTQRPGRRGYYGEFVVGGRRIQKKLANDFDAARTILRDMRARAEKAEFNLLDNDYSLESLKSAYLKRCGQELRPRTLTRYTHSLAVILKGLGVPKVKQITMEKVLTFRDQRLLQGVSPRTVNHDVVVLGAMLRWGVEKNLINSNPLKKVKPLLHDHPKEGRSLDDTEVQCLLNHSSVLWRNIWYAFLTTGLRKEELAGLRFADIDWENREVIVRSYRAKNHRERRVPIEDGLFAIFQEQAKAAPERKPGKGKTDAITAKVRERFSREHVFVTTQNTSLAHRSGLYHAFIRCYRLAGIETRRYDDSGNLVDHVDLHSLRRTFATNAIVNGADPKSVQELLGHRTLDMTMRIYAKVKTASKRQTIGRLSYGQGATAPTLGGSQPAEE